MCVVFGSVIFFSRTISLESRMLLFQKINWFIMGKMYPMSQTDVKSCITDPRVTTMRQNR